MQGVKAVAEVTAAVRELDAMPEVDVIVVTRGGGSVEDLLPFSDEGLVRAVAACRTPVVSAIGHEKDSPLLDLVADVRASTPTDAARKVVPDMVEEARASCTDLRARAQRAVRARGRPVDVAWLDSARARPVLADPSVLVTRRADDVRQLLDRSRRSLDQRLDRAQRRRRARARSGAGAVARRHPRARVRRRPDTTTEPWSAWPTTSRPVPPSASASPRASSRAPRLTREPGLPGPRPPRLRA